MSAAKVGLNGRSNEALPLIVAWLSGWVAMIVVEVVVDETVPILEPTKWGGALVAVVTVLLLGRYYYVRRERLNIDRAGDALYYLGLLLTLGSLIWSLVSPVVHGEGEHDLNDRANEIIGNFGIALVSTVAGIVGRITLQSFAGQNQQAAAEKGTQAPDIEVGQELHLMAEHLRRQMREAADAFSAFNRTTMQEAEATRSASLRHVEEGTKRLEEMTRATIEAVEKAYREMVDRIRKTGEVLEQGTEAADRATRAMWNQAASAREKVEEVTTCMERERISLEGIGETIRKEVGAAAEALGVLPENVARTNEAIDGLQATVIRAGETLKEATEATRRGHEALGRHAEDQGRGLVRQIERQRRALDQEIRAWSDYVERTAKILESASEGLAPLTKTLDVARTSIRTLGQAAETAARKVERRRLRDAGQRLRAVFDRLPGRK